jgi:SAM-dependent methyltransferase
MFALSDGDLRLKILGCGDGPASFNAEATRLGSRVTSCDPLYGFSRADISERISRTYDEVLEQTRRNEHEFVWKAITSVEDLGRVRMSAMTTFLEDFDVGRANGRYVDAELPSLPFSDDSFDLALCSHLLFLYSTQLGEGFHHEAVRELCRVALEVRIFPLLMLDGTRSSFVERIVTALRAEPFAADISVVPYEFRRGGNEMLRIRRSS